MGQPQSVSVLDELISRVESLTDEGKQAFIKEAFESTKHLKWIPNPGPQTEAYYSKADLLLYGGEPGGGKTALLNGLAFNCHQKSLIMRRQYTDLGAIIEEAIKLNGSRDGFNGSPPPKLRISDKQVIDFGAATKVGDEQHWMGRPHDFIGLDEGTHFAEIQVRFLMGWLRSTDAGQRKRVVIATNPPMTADGLWVTEMFGPWLNPQHPNPAKAGELRWFVSDEEGKDMEVSGPEPVMIGAKEVQPLSRTFIPASVKDNPYLTGTGYESQLDALPEPLRSILMGGFRTTFKDAPGQVIPTDWIKQAQDRWKPKPPVGIPMCAIGVDPAQGGEDETVLAPRYDGWYPPMIVIPGKLTPFGRDVAGHVIMHRRDSALVIVDMGGGYGGSTYEHLEDNGVEVKGYKGSEESVHRTKDGKLKFFNKRAEAYWKFREALDPSQAGGSPISLPDDPKLMADLTSAVLDLSFNGIKIEPKEKLKTRLGRSPDRGDAVVMSWMAGPNYLTDGMMWRKEAKLHQRLGRTPQVVMKKPRR